MLLTAAALAPTAFLTCQLRLGWTMLADMPLTQPLTAVHCMQKTTLAVTSHCLVVHTVHESCHRLPEG